MGALPEETTLDNGKYIIGGVLGSGGFGITYLGYHTKLKSRVAIKEYFPSDIAARGVRSNRKAVAGFTDQYDIFQQKFENEAIILQKFNHLRNIVQVKDFIRENNTSYIIMDYVEGISLKELLKRSGGMLPWDRVVPMLDPMLTALQKIHEEKIIHRDISPDNILINSRDEPILIDFGTARIGRKTGGSVAIGKEGYSPIEQMEGADLQDPRTDIYALGATYYKALTGKTPMSAIVRVQNDRLVPVKVLVPDVPQNVSDAVMKALSERIEDRWNSVSDFQDAINRFDEEIEEDQDQDQNREWDKNQYHDFKPFIPPEAEPKPVPKKKKKKKNRKLTVLLIMLITAALCVLGFLAFLLFPRTPDGPEAYLRFAQRGTPEAQVAYGHALYEGYDIPQDYEQAAAWYRKAAEQGYPDGEYYFARCYFRGTGVDRDYDAYEMWLERAANHGHIMAQLSLAKFYETGYSGRPDMKKAAEWYRVAAENGNAEAEEWLESHR